MKTSTKRKRKNTEPRWVMSEAGEAVAVLLDINEFRDMQKRLGEIATREEESAPDALALLEKGEADIKAGRLTHHADVVKAVRKRRNG
ncbi:MAG: hypothetical protein HYZ49_18875 [Chloroflexi bacterium]|nr:hypothetical protein [Chloroflexota bacterium]